MSRLADPSLCPDCRAALDPSATCTGCGLPLAGPLGQRLWETMLGADGLVEELRARSRVSVAAGGATARTAHQGRGVTGPTGGLPPAPPAGRSRGSGTPRRLPVASVPTVLLALGALCLLVAAVVFVAIAWGVLGLTGRTLALAGLTGVLGTLATTVTRRGLRGAAESLWSVVAGLSTLDLLGARSAGLAGLDALGWRPTSVVVGLALAALGVGVALWSRGTSTQEVWSAEIVAVLGGVAVTVGAGWLARDPAVGTAVLAPLLALAGVALRRPLAMVGNAVLVLALLTWLDLAAIGLDRATESASWTGWWNEARGWPLVVATLWAWLAVLAARRLALWARALLAGAALAPLVALADAPVTAHTETRDALVHAATLVALAVVARWAPRAWSLAAACLAALGAVVLLADLAWQPWSAIGLLPSTAAPSVRLDAVESLAAPWTWAVVSLSVALVALAGARLLPARAATRGLGQAAATVAAVAGTVVTVVADRPPLWGAVLATLVGAAAVAALVRLPVTRWGRSAVAVTGVGTAYLVVVGLAAALTSHQVAAVAGTVVALALAAAFAEGQRRPGSLAPAVAGAAAVLGGSYTLPAWGALAQAPSDVTATVVAAYAALVGLLAAVLSTRAPSRVALELAALAPAVLAAALAPDLTSLALVLTVLGTGAAGVSVLNRDRSAVSWLAAVVLAGATVLRVSLDVRAPELYTVPAAVLLLGFGLLRLRADRACASLDALGAGLALALVPSLLLSLEDPASLRGLLVGAAAVLALAVGVRERLSAPLLSGAGTVALLALRELAPLADAVPRWVSLALLGAALLGVGVSWEARLRNLRAAGHYLSDLR